MRSRIDKAFRDARAGNRAAFMPFITAGDPDLETTAALVEEIARRGADLVELGIPFSDPVADGPTIQASYIRALSGGIKVRDVLGMVRALRDRCQIPILTMVSFSIVWRIGPEQYFGDAASAGVDGVIIPDLPVDEGKEISRLAAKAGLHAVFLVAPTTPPERMRQIARLSSGFIYYISVTGITGARDQLPPDLAQNLETLKSLTKKPVAVGFGISQPEQVRAVAAVADGVIVGSAIVRKIHELADRPRDDLISGVGDFVASLAAARSRISPKSSA